MLAAKRYRTLDHRLFSRDAGYTEGRRMRNSRDRRAAAKGTRHGRAVGAGQWAAAEFDYLARAWAAGLPVPYPVQLDGTELLMELITCADGSGAPRLAQTGPTGAAARVVLGAARRGDARAGRAGPGPRRPLALQPAGWPTSGSC